MDSVSRPATRFFVGTSVAILAIVVVGFAPTLYLRGLFAAPPIPTYLYLHGALLTAWFVLVVAQTALIRGGSVAAHRLLGAIGVCIGAALVVMSALVTLRFADRVMHAPTAQDVGLSVTLGFAADAPLRDLAAVALWGNLVGLVAFSVLLGSAVLMRDRGDVHKRLMMIASLAILPPAIARVSRWPGLGGDLGPLVPSVLLVLLGAMVGWDLYTRRRLHWATLAGGAFLVVSIVASGSVARTDLGFRVLQRLVYR